MEFIKHKWPEILILAIMIPGFGALGKLGWDLNDRMARAETRTDGIMAAMPDLRTRVAFETVYGTFAQAVVLGKPKEVVGGWASDVAIVSSGKDQARIITVNLPTNDNSALVRQITGAVFLADEMAISFDRLSNMSADVRFTGAPPSYVDSSGSFVSFQSTESLDAAISGFANSAQSEISPVEKIDNWPALIDSLATGGDLNQKMGG